MANENCPVCDRAECEATNGFECSVSAVDWRTRALAAEAALAEALSKLGTATSPQWVHAQTGEWALMHIVGDRAGDIAAHVTPDYQGGYNWRGNGQRGAAAKLANAKTAAEAACGVRT